MLDGKQWGTHVAGGEVTTLEHELGNDTVEGSALEVEGLAAAAGTLLTSAESAEVLGGLRVVRSAHVRCQLPTFPDGGVMEGSKNLRWGQHHHGAP